MSLSRSDGEEVADDRESGAPVMTEAGSVVAPTKVGGELGVGVGEGEEAMLVVEEALVGAVRAFDLTAMPRGGDANQLVLDAASRQRDIQ